MTAVGSERLRRFCQEYGLDASDSDALAGYEVVADSSLPIERLPTVLSIKPFGRFGNKIIQLMKVITLAKRLGIREIDVSHLDLPFLDGHATTVEAGGLIFHLAGEPGIGKVALSSIFWWLDLFAPLNMPNPDLQFDLFRTYIRPLMSSRSLPGSGDDLLTVHIRGGDVFGDDVSVIDSNYVMPPGAYYILCVRHAVLHYGVRRALIVHEDRANPCLAALETHFQAIGMPYAMQSGDLDDDLVALARARYLVTVPGTFAPSAALLGENTRSIYYFRMCAHWTLLLAGGAETFMVDDPAEDYIRPGDWINSSEQRARMLDYPEAGLRMLRLTYAEPEVVAVAVEAPDRVPM